MFSEPFTEAASMKVASAAQGIGGVAAVGGGSAIYLGFTQGEWAVIGIIGGLVLAAVGTAAKIVLDAYFQAKHYRLAEKRGER